MASAGKICITTARTWNVLDCGKFNSINEIEVAMPQNIFERYRQDYSFNEHLIDKVMEWEKIKLINDQVDRQITYVEKEQKDPYVCYDVSEKLKLGKVYNYSNGDRWLRKPPIPPSYRLMKDCNTISENEVYEFYGLKQFHRGIMVNISPAWKGKKQQASQLISLFDAVFTKDCNRFSKMKYAIEDGENGDFIHAHAVFEFDPRTLKSSMKAHKKGNLINEFRKIWDKQGNIGLLQGKFAIHTTMINHEDILRDKLNYLDEEKKPISHQNKCGVGFPIVYNVGF